MAGLGAGVALAGSGGLDPSFGTGGATVLTRSTSTYPTPAALASGGKIVLVTTANGEVVVSRLLPDGSPDPTFDGDGQAGISGGGFLSAYGLAVQPDGKIVVVGSTSTGGDALVWRLKAEGGSGAANGALDPTFDTDGVADVDSGDEATARAVAIQPDGKIVVAGAVFTSPGPTKGAVWRLKADGGSGAINGALDPSFDTDGQADVDSGGNETANAVALQPDGKIVLAGSTNTAGGNAVVWRLKADGGPGATNGALDPSFDNDGAATVDGGGFAQAGGVALQPDGKILIAGFAQIGANPSVAAVWRLAANGGTGAVNGALDPTFGTGGAATVSEGSGAGASALAPAPDRRIVAAGATFDENLLAFRVLGDPFSLNVATAGTGSGSVQSSPAGIECGATCSDPFDDGAGVTLTAAPTAGSAFAGWSGAGCGGTGTCALTMSVDQAVTATFDALPPAPPPPPPKHFVLKASRLSGKAFKHTAKTVSVTITGLPAGTKISATLLAGRTTLAKAKATAATNGRAKLKFKFSRKARKRLRSKKLKTVTLKVTATPVGDTASKASKRVKLKRG